MDGNPQRVCHTNVYRNAVDGGFWEKQRVTRLLYRPKIMEIGHKYFSAVDWHDRYRQGYLNLEDSWATKRCCVWIFSTVFGIICTDASLAYRYKNSTANSYQIDNLRHKLSYYQFMGRLAFQLIHNVLWGDLDMAFAVQRNHQPAQ